MSKADKQFMEFEQAFKAVCIIIRTSAIVPHKPPAEIWQ
jgi:hypothetical protein